MGGDYFAEFCRECAEESEGRGGNVSLKLLLEIGGLAGNDKVCILHSPSLERRVWSLESEGLLELRAQGNSEN